jgi:hypothetical protein
MFVEVLYSDLSRQRVPIHEADKLLKQGVLAIIISCPDELKPRVTIDGFGYRRRAQALGKDFYYLLHYNDEGDSWYALDSRDRSEFIKFHKTKNSWKESTYRQEHPRYGYFMLVFEGAKVSDETWDKAIELFDKEVH